MTVDESHPGRAGAPEPGSEWRRGLRRLAYPLQPISTWLVVSLLALAVLNLLTVPALLHLLSVLRAAERAGTTEDGSARSSADLASTAVLVLFVAVAVFAIAWLLRARRNVDAYGGTHQHYGAGWAVGGWFVPVANLWIPVRVVRDVVRGSVLDSPGDERRDTAVVAAWWAALVASTVLDLVSVRRPETHGGLALNAAGRATEALAAVLFALVVRRVAAGQARLGDYRSRS